MRNFYVNAVNASMVFAAESAINIESFTRCMYNFPVGLPHYDEFVL